MYTYQPFTIKDLNLKNRIVMPPMCMYSSDETGKVKDFHKIHYPTRAVGGAGLIIVEATAVAPNGRISDQDLGLWEDGQIAGMAEIVRLIHGAGAKAGIQLAHAGRKCESADPVTIAPSSFPFNEAYRVPQALSADEIYQVVSSFGQAAGRALAAGFDTIELHGAHGYLIHEFLSPLANRRTDGYGGALENRIRFLQEILTSVHNVWPAEKPVQIRLSASDFLEGGLNIDQTVQIVSLLKSQADLFHISSGGLLSAPIRPYPGYQIHFTEAVKIACQVPTIAVGLISKLEQAEEILGSGRADLVALGRELLRNPYWPISQRLTHKTVDCPVPEPYERAFK